MKDYIDRTTALLDNIEKQKINNNRNIWNDVDSTKQDIYYVKPEPEHIDSDEKINPHGQH